MQELGEVIGAGGFGVVREIKNSPYVVKLMREEVCTLDAQKEFEAHKKIFETYQKLINKNPELKNILYIPEPIIFHNCKTLDECYGESIAKCAYVMENVESARPDKVQEHLIINSESDGYAGYIWCKDISGSIKYNITDILTKEEKATCQPRGAFLGPNHYKDRFNIEKISYLVGILHGIVQKAEYVPFDVEIVIDKNNKLAMYDFGMVYNKTYKDYESSLPYDMYVPSEDDKKEREEFNKGISYVMENLSGGKRKTKRNKRCKRKNKQTRKTARK